MVKTIVVHKKGFRRKGYRRKDGTYVKSAVVKPAVFKIEDRGSPGRGKQLFKVKRKGALSGLGYAVRFSEADRRIALRKAVEKYGALSVFRMLNVQVVFRNTATEWGRIENRKRFEADMDFVERNFL